MVRARRRSHRVWGVPGHDQLAGDAVIVDGCISFWHILHMRTTITISDELLAEAQKLSGKTGYSDAIVTSLEDYVALRKRLSLLEDLFEHKTPHSAERIRRMRRARRWSS